MQNTNVDAYPFLEKEKQVVVGGWWWEEGGMWTFFLITWKTSWQCQCRYGEEKNETKRKIKVIYAQKR